MSTKKELLEMAEKLKNDEITTNEADSILLNLFLKSETINELYHLAHNGLPDECILGHDTDELKFCKFRNETGNKCKRCSNYE